MSLKKAAAKGVRWTSLSMFFVITTQLMRLVILGHLLGPDAFGLMAMILVAIGFISLLGQAGISEAIIQRANPTHIELSSLHWLNVLMGVVLYGILLLLIPPIALFYATSELIYLLPWAGLGFLIVPWGTLIKALLQKRLDFKSLAIVEVIAVIIGLFVAILFALSGYDVWSLIWGQLAQSTCMTILFIFLGWRRNMLPGTCFRFRAVQSYMSFGFNLMGSKILNYFNSRIDQMVIGSLLGSQALGYYSMAFNLVLEPISRVNPVLTQVAFPILVKLQSDKKSLMRGYFRMIDLLTSINAPLMLGIAVVAPLLIPIVLGDQWMPIIPLMQVLALFSLVRSIGNAGGCLILACGRADLSLYWNFMLFIFIPFVVVIGAKTGGLLGVAWTLLGLQILLLFVWYYFVVRVLLGGCFSRYIAAMGAPVILAIIMAGVILILASFILNYSPAIQLVLEVSFGGVIYVGLLFLLRKEFAREQIQLFLNR